MRIKCIGCDVLARVIYQSAAISPHVVDVELLRWGLHEHPNDLRSQLQARIDAVEGAPYDAIALAYGLCGKSTHGITARNLPLVMPRAHDCITIFLGSRGRYREQFEGQPGTFWYMQDYIERRVGTSGGLVPGAGNEKDMEVVYAEYVEKYGQDNADYLMEVMGAWQAHYQRAAFIDMGIGDGSKVEAQAQEEAARRGWSFERLAGDPGLIRRLLAGEWDADFLVLQPGQQAQMTYDDRIMGCPLAPPAPPEPKN